MNYDANNPYTFKSQYLQNLILQEENNVNIIGNDQDNIFMGNAGIYVGTINAYSLTNASSGVVNASQGATSSERSLFVSDYNISNKISWNKLVGLNNDGTGTMPTENLIFGKTYDTDYKLRVLSAGNDPVDDSSRTPSGNEWDVIYTINAGYIKNTGTFDSPFKSWGQDTCLDNNTWRAVRGAPSNTHTEDWKRDVAYEGVSWRPALEVSSSLGADELNGITLSLGEHTIEIISSTGVAEAQFTVIANGLPETGDNTALPIFVALMLTSVLGMGTMFVLRKRSMTAREK